MKRPRPRRPRWYRLDGHAVVPADNVLQVDLENNRVAFTILPDDREISTVFLGMDHAYQGPPQLFETAVFTEAGVRIIDRCATWEEAEAMHREAVERLTAEIAKV